MTADRDELRDVVAGVEDRERAVDQRESDLDQREAAVAQREAAVSAAEAAQHANQFGNGTFIVGRDIQAGTYRSSGSDDCYWARLRGVGGTLDDIITNHIGGGTQTVAIRSSDYAFESSRCGTWTKIG